MNHPGDSLDRGSRELLDTAHWTVWMTVLLLVLAVSVWVAIVEGLSTDYKGTGGAIYTASGVALLITLGGQPLVRWLGPKLGASGRHALLILVGLAVVASFLLNA